MFNSIRLSVKACAEDIRWKADMLPLMVSSKKKCSGGLGGAFAAFAYYSFILLPVTFPMRVFAKLLDIVFLTRFLKSHDAG